MITTAFLYAGALQKDREVFAVSDDESLDLWDDWQGHIGFVQTCDDYAQAIETWLDHPARYDDNRPGVLAYEIIEPLGAWLIAESTPANRGTDEVLAEFQKRYLAWIEDTDAHGIKPTDRVLDAHGNVLQEAVPEEKRFHIIHTSSGGPVLVSFYCEDDRAEWCEKQDDTFETFIAVDGLIHNVLTPIIGE